jgi:thymidylate synthase (FAD)
MKARILDHGYIEFIESWGHGKEQCEDMERGIIEAARQSTQGSFRGWEEDAKLLSYLFESKPQHSTPFEFSGMTIEVQAPIFVFREWQRHRTQSYNEMSARYAPLPDLNYIPTTERMLLGGGHLTRQASGVEGAQVLTQRVAELYQDSLQDYYDSAERLYQYALGKGVPKELARIVLPVGRYSRMRASANLRNWLAFLTLRTDEKAQWEIRQFANAVGELISQKFPQTYRLFRK